MKILIAGELNPDLILQNYQTFPHPGKEVLVEDLLLTLGSSSAICAVGLARLGDRVTFAANVGADTYGDYCIGLLGRGGIGVSLVNRPVALKTGITVSITSSKDRALVTYPGAISSLRAEDLPKGIFAGYRHFHVSAYFLQDGLRPGLMELFAEARRLGLSTSLDTGYDPSEQWSGELIDTLREVDVFLPNESEIQGITNRQDVMDGLRALDRMIACHAEARSDAERAFSDLERVRCDGHPHLLGKGYGGRRGGLRHDDQEFLPAVADHPVDVLARRTHQKLREGLEHAVARLMAV